jgi:hypothetical protein
MNLRKFMRNYEAKITQNADNLLKQQFLMHPNYVLYKISIVGYSY